MSNDIWKKERKHFLAVGTVSVSAAMATSLAYLYIGLNQIGVLA